MDVINTVSNFMLLLFFVWMIRRLLKPAKTFGGKGIGDTVYTLQGERALLEVYEDRVNITGGRFFPDTVHTGIRSIRTIPFFSIATVEFKKGVPFCGPSLHFTLPGGQATLDPLAVRPDSNSFECVPGGHQDALVLEIKDYIEKKIMEVHSPKASPSGSGLSDELQKLADMKEKKILSEEEFQAAKRRLLG